MSYFVNAFKRDNQPIFGQNSQDIFTVTTGTAAVAATTAGPSGTNILVNRLFAAYDVGATVVSISVQTGTATLTIPNNTGLSSGYGEFTLAPVAGPVTATVVALTGKGGVVGIEYRYV